MYDEKRGKKLVVDISAYQAVKQHLRLTRYVLGPLCFMHAYSVEKGCLKMRKQTSREHPCTRYNLTGTSETRGMMHMRQRSLRFDVVVDLARGNGDEGILQVKCWILCLFQLPNVMQNFATDAAGEMGVELASHSH
jgi:hypothetical protein